MKNSELAEKAAETMGKHGWTKGIYGNPDTGFCLLGAGIFSTAVGFRQLAAIIRPGITCTAPACVDTSRTPYELVIDHNDSHCHSKEQALGVLDRAAKHWRNLGE